ncbi:unnamed protein product [Urochloa humidicola]
MPRSELVAAAGGEMGRRKLSLQYYLEYCHYLWRRRLIASILVCLAMHLYRINKRKRKRAITYAPMIDRDVERLTRLNRLYHGTEAHCISELRMRKGVFHRLCAELRSRALLEETFHVTIEEQVDAFASSRERTVIWHEDQSKYMLEWYIEYLKKQHKGFKIRKPHHMLCADALNKKFTMGVTVDQVDRHYRYHKENWGYIAKALSKSSNSFDHIRCLVLMSESEKPEQSDRERRLLSKPIKFYHEMKELFTGSSADGSLATDQNTCMDNSDGSDSDDSRELFDLNCYTQPEDPPGEDSDTLPTPPRHAPVDNNSSSTSRVSKKHPRGNKSPTKKPKKKSPKKKSRFAESTDEIIATMKSLRDTLVGTAPPQMPQLTDPHAVLWQKLEAIPMTPDQRVLVGEHLSSKENKGKRGWFCNASADTLHAWVFKFLCEKDGINL